MTERQLEAQRKFEEEKKAMEEELANLTAKRARMEPADWTREAIALSDQHHLKMVKAREVFSAVFAAESFHAIIQRRRASVG